MESSAIKPNPSPQQDVESERSSMDVEYESRLFKWCEVKQTEVVHEGPRSQCDDLLIRLRATVQHGDFALETNPPHSFLYNFDTDSMVIVDGQKVWVNFSSAKERARSWRDLTDALANMRVRRTYLEDIVSEIFKKVQPAVPLPQLAIDVNVRVLGAVLHGSLEDYDDEELYPLIKEAFRDATSATSHDDGIPPSCCICLEDFRGGVDDKFIARLPCSHYFHGPCTAVWVKIRQTCPICRSQIMPLLSDGTNEHFNPDPILCPRS